MRMRMQMPAKHLKAKANVSIYCCYFCSLPPSFPPPTFFVENNLNRHKSVDCKRRGRQPSTMNTRNNFMQLPSPFQRHSTTLWQRLCRWEVTKLKSWPNPRDSRALQLQSNSWRTQGLFNCLFCVCVCVRDSDSKCDRERYKE